MASDLIVGVGIPTMLGVVSWFISHQASEIHRRIDRIHRRIDDHLVAEERDMKGISETMQTLAREVSYIAGQLGIKS